MTPTAECVETQQVNEQPATRRAYTAGLRRLADLLDDLPDLPLPFVGSVDGSTVSLNFLGDKDAREAMTRARRLIGGQWTKVVTESAEYGDYLRLKGQIEGLHVSLVAYRDSVCRRVVTGVREVTREVPDPDAPTVTLTETVEDVEWDCGPLLADSEAVA